MVTLGIDWAKSPRIILVDHPEVEITQQDLIDLLRDAEYDFGNLDDKYIVAGSGKESLDAAGTQVGITNTLQNALLGFEADTVAKSQGTVTTADALGKTLIDSAATFITDGVTPGAVIINFDDYSVGSVIEVISETEIDHIALSNGTGDDWGIGDNYKIWNIKQGIISGGNLVAVDDAGLPLATAVYPTPFTQIILTSSASATLSDLDAIQYSSYGGGVSVDIGSANSGTTYPNGNKENPVNNIADAVFICNERGFDTIYLLSNIDLNLGDNVSGKTLVGQSPTRTEVVIYSGANVYATKFTDVTISGEMDGRADVYRCTVGNLDYFDGAMVDCQLAGVIKLLGFDLSQFRNCYDGLPGPGTPIIDCNGDGRDLGVWGYYGGLGISNKTGSDKFSINMDSGRLVLYSTVTAGEILVKGVGLVEDNSTGTAIINTDGLISTESVTLANLDAIYINADTGEAGTDFPIGTTAHPVNNLTDAYTLAVRYGLKRYVVCGSITLDRAYIDWRFEGSTSNIHDLVDLNGQDIEHSTFCCLKISGAQGGTEVAFFKDCVMYEATGLMGQVVGSTILNSIGVGLSGSMLNLKDCAAGGMTGVILDMVGSNRIMGGANLSGLWTVKNMLGGPPPAILQCGFDAGSLVIDVSCTGGLVTVQGNAQVVNNGSATLQDLSTSYSVWEEPTTDHATIGTLGGDLAKSAEITGITNSIMTHVVNSNILGLTLEQTLDLLRKLSNNRLELKEGATDNWELYDDDDSTVLLSYDVTDKTGTAITISADVPARRTRGA